MSGDVQPRKRKDKKKKKDDLGVEEPRGTAAALGEGDVFMHSQSEHGTGGHWCAKVIFFSLLAVLITLIGLIILENRGLTELEANSVESRYSGVLEGWIEDAPDEDHHDEHTLELKHHDEDEGDPNSDLEHDNHDDDDENDEHDNDDDDDVDNESDEDERENESEEDEEQNVDDSEEENDDENQESEEENPDTAEDEDKDNIEETSFKKLYDISDRANEEEDNDDDLQKESEELDDKTDKNQNDDTDGDDDQDDTNDDDDQEETNDDDDDVKDQDVDEDAESHQTGESLEERDYESKEDTKIVKNNDNDDDDDDGNDSQENDDYLHNDSDRENEDEEEHEEEDDEEPANVEIETIEKEVSDDIESTEALAADEDVDDQSPDISEELSPEDDTSLEDDDVEFLEPDELDELPIVEPITAPKGKPLAEVGESATEKPQDTLADEEEYERQQEELRKEREQNSQSMWLKLTVGGALLVATHAVLRRATASRETDTEEDEQDFREETPLSDRRMTLISEPVPPPPDEPKLPEISRPIEKEVKKETSVIVQSSPSYKEKSEEDDDEIIVTKPIQPVAIPQDIVDRELYSDEEELEDIENEEEEEEEPIKTQQAVPQVPQIIPDVTKEVTPEPDDDDDVEIIDEEQLEEELEEEEISDVDDAELLNRLEAKYGRLPEPERPARTHKDGGNSVEDEWPGEPEDAFWSEHLEQAQRELRQGEWSAAVEKASAPRLQSSARARYIIAQALDATAEAKKDNQLLSRAIAAYLELLKMNEKLSDKKLLEVATRTLDRIKFRGTYLSAEPVYKLLIRRFPDDPTHRNNLTISLLMANRADLAENVLKETLKLWPNDRIALAHHGFILKTLHNRLEEAVDAFTKALEGDTGAANESRFYYHLGDALLLLRRFSEAHEVHKRGAALGHFLSPNQRSLYNVDRLKSKPWWNVEQTPYSRIARALEKSWKEILKEGEAAKVLFEKEKEGLKERGEWSQLDLFARGREVPNRCSRAPVTCGIVKSEMAASGCRRGQIKFSLMEAGTHVRPHVGPTNCRLRMHLGLSNTKNTFIRVDKETRQWETGKVLMFDDSFEHEVWHNGTGARLVLIVDVWHPDLTPAERRQLPAI